MLIFKCVFFKRKKTLVRGSDIHQTCLFFCQNHLVQMISGKKIKYFVWHVEWRWSNSCGKINSQVISQLIRTHVIDTHLSPFQKKMSVFWAAPCTDSSHQRVSNVILNTHTHTHTQPMFTCT